MAERLRDQGRFSFKTVQLLKDQSLGIGSYGAVCKAICDDLVCAAKIIHPTLFDPLPLHQIAPQREHRLPIRRFEQECEFMSNMKHPNIVQYLGTYRDSTDTRLPVLLMEPMDDSLTHFLESSPQPIPYHIAVNICHDVTLALSFLHSNNIVHRDLSSNNVLLRGNILAKVTDFGMARLGDINSHGTRLTSTMCPGTDVYMPPEAVQDKPVYTEKIDCFSFGVITLQILTRLFPKPGDRMQKLELNHPGLPVGTVYVHVPEMNRRQDHVSQVDPDQPLLPVILDCLKDRDNERPSAHQLCERIVDLKRMEKYINSARTVQDKDEVIQSLASRVEEKDRTISSKEEENQQLRQQLQLRDEQMEQKELIIVQIQHERGEARRRSEEKERQLGRVNQQLHEAEQKVGQFERRVAELEQLLSKKNQQNPETSSRGKELTNIKLKWREGKRAPCRMGRLCDAVVDGNTVYVRAGVTVEIYSYDATTDSWCQLPDCANKHGSVTVINGQLTTVGGFMSNDLFSLTGESSNRRWTKEYPPMPTEREGTTSLCTGATLIVAGGAGEYGVLLSKVEVMNTENHQWSTAADLPQPMYLASITVCGDDIYMLGGFDERYTSTKSVYTCSVSALLQSCVPSSLEAKLKKTSLSDKASAWRQVADLPVTRSTCESFNGRLLAIGGMDDSRKATTAVYEYSSTSNSWEVISHMTTGQYDCFTGVLPNNKLVVVGGRTDRGYTDTVKLASVIA